MIETEEIPELSMLSIPIVGETFRSQKAIKTLLSAQDGSRVFLKPDPRNQYDSNAIKVLMIPANGNSDYSNFVHVGFVQRHFAALINDKLESNICEWKNKRGKYILIGTLKLMNNDSPKYCESKFWAQINSVAMQL